MARLVEVLLLFCPAAGVVAGVALGAAEVDLSASAPELAPPFNSTWLRSFSSKVNLTVLQGDASSGGVPLLRWTEPEHFSAVFSYLKATSLEKDGATVNVSMRWRSSGDNACPASCYAGHEYCQSKSCQEAKCVSKSVNCLGGTGDFRIALLDT
eukprot:COSAG02_NODE_3272_length_7033_cov_4.657485_2_plen_154_part_00